MKTTTKEIINSIQPNVSSTSTRANETSPVPVIILTTKLEVSQDDCDFSTSNNEDEEDEKKETKNVVVSIQPNSGEDEEELKEDSTKGEDTSKRNSDDILHVKRKFVGVARNSCRLNGDGDGIRTISKNSTDEDERN